MLYGAETLERRRVIDWDAESQQILKRFQEDRDILEGLTTGLSTNGINGQRGQNEVRTCLFITGAVIVVCLW